MSVVACVWFSDLHIQYYHKSMLRIIAKAIDTVVRIDYNTESTEQGRFTHLVVSVDLTKLLVSKIRIKGHRQRVEYEGLPTTYFKCGCYGHLREQCPRTSREVATDGESRLKENIKVVSSQSVAQRKKFGSWMQVVQWERRNDRKGNNLINKKGYVTTGHNGSRLHFDLIVEIGEGDSFNTGLSANLRGKSVLGVNAGEQRKGKEINTSRILGDDEQGIKEGEQLKKIGPRLGRLMKSMQGPSTMPDELSSGKETTDAAQCGMLETGKLNGEIMGLLISFDPLATIHQSQTLLDPQRNSMVWIGDQVEPNIHTDLAKIASSNTSP